ncbi:MAG TPA: PEP-CTERM sorting domain-containing protein [Bryobacteraceae bacterium]|nr:PEP-CTERM sorting domain-containing protein [Bryobacteraceae bacterium]
MIRLMKWLVPLAMLGLCVTLGHAGPMIICIESDSGHTAGDYDDDLSMGGCATSIPGTDPLLYVASDGLVYFDPFEANYHTSDGIVLNSNWLPDPAFSASFGPGLWTKLSDDPIWVLPGTPGADDSGAEPIGAWYFPGAQWALNPAPGDVFWIMDSNGSVSDIITVGNTGPGASAEITFQSGAPEPGTLSLLGLALGVFAASRLKKRRP